MRHFGAIAQHRLRPNADKTCANIHKDTSAIAANWKKVLEAAKEEAKVLKEQGDDEAANAEQAAVDDAVNRLHKIAAAAKFHGPTSGAILQTTVGMMLVAARERGEKLSWRERGYLLLNEPASDRLAFWLGRVVRACIICSALATTAETVSWINQPTGPAMWMQLKILFNTLFTLEAALRVATFIPFKSVLRSGFVWLDLLTVFPLYARMLLYPDSMTTQGYLNKSGGLTIRIIEAFASFRVLKLCRYFEGANILALAIGKAMAQLVVPLFMLVLMVFCFASIVHEIEYDDAVHACTQHWINQGADAAFIKLYPDGVSWDCTACQQRQQCPDSVCDQDYEQRCLTCEGYPTGHPECLGVAWGQTFPDIPRSMWFMFVTVSTVGYGDVSPGTWQGQLFVCCVIFCGIIFLAMPLAIVGSTFGEVWDERQIFKLQRHLRQLLAANGIDPTDACMAFKKMDESGDGQVSFDEFTDFVKAFHMALEENEIKNLWKALDADGSGTMSLEEFISRAYPGIDLSSVEALPKKPEEEEAAKRRSRRNSVVQQLSQHAELVAALDEQKARTEAMDTRLGAIEKLLEEQVALQRRAHAGRQGSSTPQPQLSRGRSPSWGAGRCDSSRAEGGEMSKGKPEKPDRQRTRADKSRKPTRGGAPEAAISATLLAA